MMIVLPVDPLILSALPPADYTTNNKSRYNTAHYWFTIFFKGHTVMYESIDEIKDNIYFFLIDEKVKEEIAIQILPINKGFTKIGSFQLISNGIKQLICYDMEMPLDAWEREYVAEYNSKYNTNFITPGWWS